MLDIGLIFEVVGAFCLGLIEASHMSMGHSVYPEPGGIAVWITLFVFVVPNTLGKTALAAFASAAMGPLTLIVAAYANERPVPRHLFSWSTPHLTWLSRQVPSFFRVLSTAWAPIFPGLVKWEATDWWSCWDAVGWVRSGVQSIIFWLVQQQ